MSKKSNPAVTFQPEANNGTDRKYPTQKLLKSRHLDGYQKDFAKVILTEPAYSISEAKQVLDQALKGRSR